MDRQVDEVTATCRRYLAIDIGQTDGVGAGRIWRSLADFAWDPDSSPLLNLKISALPSEVENVHNLVEGPGAPALEVAVISQTGFGSAEVSWFGNEADEDLDKLAEIVRRVREGVSSFQGAVVVQKCPTALKDRIDVWGAEPSGIGVMRRLKAQYDPNNIMNPGRFVGRL